MYYIYSKGGKIYTAVSEELAYVTNISFAYNKPALVNWTYFKNNMWEKVTAENYFCHLFKRVPQLPKTFHC
jgi:hypothetical protein